jgi:hypothetical protein
VKEGVVFLFFLLEQLFVFLSVDVELFDMLSVLGYGFPEVFDFSF